MQNNLPVGFYDSGVGGVSVLRESVKLLPHENFIYFGDMANAPYGTKTEDEIKDCSLASGEFLFRAGVKAIVIACNTATSIVVQEMRQRYRIPVISIEPAIKPALEQHSEGGILVLATPATLQQKRYGALVERLNATGRVVNVACENLADLVENEFENKKILLDYLSGQMLPYKDSDIRGIVIGCTHYSFISDLILQAARDVLGEVDLYDGRFGTARHLAHVLEENGLLNDASTSEGKIQFFTSAPDEAAAIQKLQFFFQK